MTDSSISDDGIIYQATVDGDGVLTGLIATNVVLPAALTLSAQDYEALQSRTGRARLVDGAWSDFEPAPLVPVKRAVTPRQLWLAASSIGVSKADVLAQIDAMTDAAARDWLRIEITEASLYEPDHPAIDDLRALLGIPQAQFDDLWIWASGI